MLSRFTERARRVLMLAQQEAIRLGHDYMEPSICFWDCCMKGKAWLRGP